MSGLSPKGFRTSDQTSNDNITPQLSNVSATKRSELSIKIAQESARIDRETQTQCKDKHKAVNPFSEDKDQSFLLHNQTEMPGSSLKPFVSDTKDYAGTQQSIQVNTDNLQYYYNTLDNQSFRHRKLNELPSDIFTLCDANFSAKETVQKFLETYEMFLSENPLTEDSRKLLILAWKEGNYSKYEKKELEIYIATCQNKIQIALDNTEQLLQETQIFLATLATDQKDAQEKASHAQDSFTRIRQERARFNPRPQESDVTHQRYNQVAHEYRNAYSALIKINIDFRHVKKLQRDLSEEKLILQNNMNIFTNLADSIHPLLTSYPLSHLSKADLETISDQLDIDGHVLSTEDQMTLSGSSNDEEMIHEAITDDQNTNNIYYKVYDNVKSFLDIRNIFEHFEGSEDEKSQLLAQLSDTGDAITTGIDQIRTELHNKMDALCASESSTSNAKEALEHNITIYDNIALSLNPDPSDPTMDEFLQRIRQHKPYRDTTQEFKQLYDSETDECDASTIPKDVDPNNQEDQECIPFMEGKEEDYIRVDSIVNGQTCYINYFNPTARKWIAYQNWKDEDAQARGLDDTLSLLPAGAIARGQYLKGSIHKGKDVSIATLPFTEVIRVGVQNYETLDIIDKYMDLGDEEIFSDGIPGYGDILSKAPVCKSVVIDTEQHKGDVDKKVGYTLTIQRGNNPEKIDHIKIKIST